MIISKILLCIEEEKMNNEIIVADISDGEIPSSLRYDSVHFNAKGYQIVANCIYKQGKILGYWS